MGKSQISTKKEDFEKTYNKLVKVFHPHGMRCGKEIAKKLKKMNNFTFPLYRSALVVTPQKNGTITLEFYHDPHWMGDKITKESLKKFKDNQAIFLQGQRSGVDVWYGDGLRDISIKISNLFIEELVEVAKKHQQELDKKWNDAIKIQKKEAKRRPTTSRKIRRR